MVPQVQVEVLPFISFEARHIAQVDNEGKPFFKDEDWVVIYSPGGKDRVDKNVDSWIRQLEVHQTQKRVSGEYVRQVKAAYADFKAGKETVNGTPLEALGLTPQQMKMLRDMHCATVEQLAAGNEELVQRLGMGGRNLKSKAQVFMSAREGPAAIASQMTSLRIKTDSQEAQINKLKLLVEDLVAENKRLAQSREREPEPDLPDPQTRLQLSENDDELVDGALAGMNIDDPDPMRSDKIED
jgi:cell division protein FtsB